MDLLQLQLQILLEDNMQHLYTFQKRIKLQL